MVQSSPCPSLKIKHDIPLSTAVTQASPESKFLLTKDTPYLGLTGELCGVCCEDFEENLPRYNGSTPCFPSSRNNIADGEPDITRDIYNTNSLRLSTHSDVSLSNSNASEFEQSFERARDILGGYDLASSKDFDSSRDYGRNGLQADNVSDGSSNYTANNNKSSKASTEKKKKSSNWYNVSYHIH